MSGKQCPMTKVAEWTAICAAVLVSYKVVHALHAKVTKKRAGCTEVPLDIFERCCVGSQEPDLASYERLQLAIQLASEAGAAMREVIDGAKNITHKGKFDLVTETDQANEKLIFEGLRAKFPNDLFIGEESSADAGSIAALTDAPTWIVDPIDGTTNFVHGLPLTCVSIGFMVNKEATLGVVYDPCADEMFVAMKGVGSFLNGRRITASGEKQLEKAVIVIEYGYQRNPVAMQHMFDATAAMAAKTQALRQLGTGAIDLCWVGCGRVDGVYAGVAGEGWKPWDYAAGVVIANEAGATTLKCNGQPFDVFGESVMCASSKELAEEILETLKPHLL